MRFRKQQELPQAYLPHRKLPAYQPLHKLPELPQAYPMLRKLRRKLQPEFPLNCCSMQINLKVP
jgi:hypothetical protein